MPDQFSKLVGYTSKYPYLVGISTDSGNLGSGILISAKFVLTCGHVLQDSTWVEVITGEGRTSARAQKVDDSLDLALLELTRPISAPKAKFTDSPLQPGLVLLAVGVQATPGQPDALSVAEIKLRHGNQNDADGTILDIQLQGGARPGYSGGPIVVKKGGALLCVGVMRRGGAGATATNAVGLGSIRAFVEEYIPDMTVVKSGTNAVSIRRRLIFAAILFGVVVVGAIAKWHYMASHSPEVISGAVIVDTQKPEKTASGQPTPAKSPPLSLPQRPDARLNPKTKDSALQDSTPTAPAEVHSVQATEESSVPPQTVAGSARVDQGNPDVKVWVNTSSKVYHCPGTRWYDNTKHGEYMTQAEAQKKGNRPAYGKLCE